MGYKAADKPHDLLTICTVRSKMEGNPLFDEIIEWSGQLLKGDERVLIMVASARLDDALRRFLQSCMLHEGGGTDSLFAPDRPLGSFSSRILLAFRLGLIDSDFESFLQTLRKLRNDAAHSVRPIQLDVAPHVDRISHLYSLMHGSKLWAALQVYIHKRPTPKDDPKSCLFFALTIATFNLEIAASKPRSLLSEPRCTFQIVGATKPLETETSEQGSADQPATAPESKPDGDSNPESESEVRPQ